MKSTGMTGIVISLVVCAFVSPVSADVTTIMRAGGWEAYGGRSTDDVKVCGISATGGGRWLGVKYYDGDNHLTIQLTKNTWRIPAGRQFEVYMQFDNEVPWQARATSFYMPNVGDALQFKLNKKDIEHWFSEFVASNSLYLRFPNSYVEDWEADLSSSHQIAQAMIYCLEVMAGSYSPRTRRY